MSAALAAATLALATLGGAQAAHAQTWPPAGTSTTFINQSGLLVLGANRTGPVVLPQKELWHVTGADIGWAEFDPRSVRYVGGPDQAVLVASRGDVAGRRVVEISRDKHVRWSYSLQDAQAGGFGFSDRSWDAQRLAVGYAGVRNTTLLVDRSNGRVFEVDSRKRKIWQYGDVANSDPDWRPGAGELADPFSATRLTNGNTLIVDGTFRGNRVIEVKTNDYKPGRPSDGYTAASIVWQYGHTGMKGPGGASTYGADGYLHKPKFAERLSGERTLIVDEGSEGAGQVLIVTSGGSIEWRCGPGQINGDKLPARFTYGPTSATRLPNGNCLVINCVQKDPWPLIVSQSHEAVDVFGRRPYFPGTFPLKEPRMGARTPSGSFLLADSGAGVVEIGYGSRGTVDSPQIDCGLPGVDKTFRSLTWKGSGTSKTTVALAYRINGEAWRPAGSTHGPGSVFLPAKTTGLWIEYRAALSTSDLGVTPELTGVQVEYEIAQDAVGDKVPAPPEASPNGGGAGATSAGGNSTGSSSGVHVGPGSGSAGTGGQAAGTATTSRGGGSPAAGGNSGGAGATNSSGGSLNSSNPGPSPQVVQRGYLLKKADSKGRASFLAGPSPKTTPKSPPWGVAQSVGLLMLGLLYAGGTVWPSARPHVRLERLRTLWASGIRTS